MPKPTIAKLQHDIVCLNGQIEHLGNCLAQSTSLVQTQDGEIGRLTVLNTTLLRIIDRLTAKQEAHGAQPSQPPVE